MKIENLELVPDAIVPCVMNIIAEYYPECETVTIDVDESDSFPEITINETSYIIGNSYDIERYITDMTEDSFQDWCFENRITDNVLKYIDEDKWRDINREDFELVFECEYINTFGKYKIYRKI